MRKQLQNASFFAGLLAICFSTTSRAQVSNYNFSSLAGTYTEITGGTVLFQGDPANEIDDDFAAVTIPFSFTFNGSAYTTAYVNTNGAVSFGGGNSEYQYPLEFIDDDAAIVAAFGTDLYSGDYPASTITAQTIGAAPNRTLVIQWKHWQALNQDDSSDLNFQIRLNEAGGIAASQSVQFSYGFIFLDDFTDLDDVQVGLRGATAADYVNRSSTTGWESTVAGIDIEDFVETTSSLLPTVGQMITYTQVSPLAINLEQIAAVNNGSTNQITWSSAHEDAGDQYVLEHSSDGRSFSSLAAINGKGQAANYTYTDNAPFVGTTYYRLKLVSLNDKIVYSKIVSADMKTISQNFAIYPNPAKSYIRFNITGDYATANIIIYDQVGNAVINSKITEGANQIDVSSLASGVYNVTYSNGGNNQKARFIKQ